MFNITSTFQNLMKKKNFALGFITLSFVVAFVSFILTSFFTVATKLFH